MTDKVIPLAYISTTPIIIDPQDSSDGNSVKSNDSLSNNGQSPIKSKESLNLFPLKSN